MKAYFNDVGNLLLTSETGAETFLLRRFLTCFGKFARDRFPNRKDATQIVIFVEMIFSYKEQP